MNRAALQCLCRTRLHEAKTLLEHGLPEAAFFLTGFAVECALKACIAKATRRHDFPDRRRVSESYTHDLAQLVRVAGLHTALADEESANPAFAVHWALVKDWKSASRNEGQIDMKVARETYQAVVTRRSGVLPWLSRHW